MNIFGIYTYTFSVLSICIAAQYAEHNYDRYINYKNKSEYWENKFKKLEHNYKEDKEEIKLLRSQLTSDESTESTDSTDKMFFKRICQH